MIEDLYSSSDGSNYLRIDVGGKDNHIFEKTREKLIQAVISFLDTTIDQTVQPAIREKAQKFTHLAVDYSKVKEERLNIDNDKILAEIEETYSKARLNDAERRIKDAEADAKEFENRLNKLVTALRVVKVVIAGSKGEEEIIFLKQIDEFLHVIATAKGDPKTLTE